MAYHGYDPGDRNNWYQSPSIGPMGQGPPELSVAAAQYRVSPGFAPRRTAVLDGSSAQTIGTYTGFSLYSHSYTPQIPPQQYYPPSPPSQSFTQNPQFHTQISSMVDSTHSFSPIHSHMTHSVYSLPQTPNHLFYTTSQPLQHPRNFHSPCQHPPTPGEVYHHYPPTQPYCIPTNQFVPPPSTHEQPRPISDLKQVETDLQLRPIPMEPDRVCDWEVPIVDSDYSPFTPETTVKLKGAEKPLSPPRGSGELQVHKEHTDATLCELQKYLKSSMDTFISEFKEELRLLRGSSKSPASRVDTPLKLGSPPSSTPKLIPATTESSSSLSPAAHYTPTQAPDGSSLPPSIDFDGDSDSETTESIAPNLNTNEEYACRYEDLTKRGLVDKHSGSDSSSEDDDDVVVLAANSKKQNLEFFEAKIKVKELFDSVVLAALLKVATSSAAVLDGNKLENQVPPLVPSVIPQMHANFVNPNFQPISSVLINYALPKCCRYEKDIGIGYVVNVFNALCVRLKHYIEGSKKISYHVLQLCFFGFDKKVRDKGSTLLTDELFMEYFAGTMASVISLRNGCLDLHHDHGLISCGIEFNSFLVNRNDGYMVALCPNIFRDGFNLEYKWESKGSGDLLMLVSPLHVKLLKNDVLVSNQFYMLAKELEKALAILLVSLLKITADIREQIELLHGQAKRAELYIDLKEMKRREELLVLMGSNNERNKKNNGFVDLVIEEIIEFLPINLEFSSSRYSSSLVVPITTIAIQFVGKKHILDLLLAALFGNVPYVFGTLSVILVNKLNHKKESLDVTCLATIFFVTYVLSLHMQLGEKCMPPQIVEFTQHYITKKDLVTFWIWVPTALLSLALWILNLHGLIVIKVQLLISDIFLNRELKFDIATRLVVYFGEDFHWRGASCSQLPEYYRLHYLTTKFDVYGFGVLLLEILGGRKVNDTQYAESRSIVEWAVPLIKVGDIIAILDPVLKLPHDVDALKGIVNVACSLLEHCAPYFMCYFDGWCQYPSLLSFHFHCKHSAHPTSDPSNSSVGLLYVDQKLDYFALGFIKHTMHSNLSSCKEACLGDYSCLVLFFENNTGKGRMHILVIVVILNVTILVLFGQLSFGFLHYCDFGFGLYIDHHYYLGYLLYGISVLAKIELEWEMRYKPQFDSLAADSINLDKKTDFLYSLDGEVTYKETMQDGYAISKFGFEIVAFR